MSVEWDVFVADRSKCNCSELGCKICKPPYKYVHTPSCGCKSCDMLLVYKFFIDEAIKRTKLVNKALKNGR